MQEEKVIISAEQRLEKLRGISSQCQRCVLFKTRRKHVFGEGNPRARVMFIGEGPGEDEDKTGRPFIGRCGQLLRRMITSIGLDPTKDCYIANAVKDRPPNNRVPEPEEIEACLPFLKKQIEIISPEILVLLGKTAVKAVMPEQGEAPIGKLREISKDLSIKFCDIPVFITYHPSALLRSKKYHPAALEDFRFIGSLVKEIVEIQVSVF